MPFIDVSLDFFLAVSYSLSLQGEWFYFQDIGRELKCRKKVGKARIPSSNINTVLKLNFPFLDLITYKKSVYVAKRKKLNQINKDMLQDFPPTILKEKFYYFFYFSWFVILVGIIGVVIEAMNFMEDFLYSTYIPYIFYHIYFEPLNFFNSFKIYS